MSVVLVNDCHLESLEGFVCLGDKLVVVSQSTLSEIDDTSLQQVDCFLVLSLATVGQGQSHLCESQCDWRNIVTGRLDPKRLEEGLCCAGIVMQSLMDDANRVVDFGNQCGGWFLDRTEEFLESADNVTELCLSPNGAVALALFVVFRDVVVPFGAVGNSKEASLVGVSKLFVVTLVGKVHDEELDLGGIELELVGLFDHGGTPSASIRVGGISL